MAPDGSPASSCYFDELLIRARSPWHRDQYNQHLEHAKFIGLSTEQAREYAIQQMKDFMSESKIRPRATV